MSLENTKMNREQTANNSQSINSNTTSQEVEEIDLKELLVKGLEHWHWFVVGAILALAIAFFYLWWATPIYEVQGTVVINEEGQPSVNLGGLEQVLSLRAPKGSLDNELEILQSHSSIRTTVEELGLYISTVKKEGWKKKELYQEAPLQVVLSPLEAQKIEEPIIIEYTLHADQSLEVKAYPESKEKEEELIRQATFTKIPAVLSTPEGNITFNYSPTYLDQMKGLDNNLTTATQEDGVPQDSTTITSAQSAPIVKGEEERYQVTIQRPQEAAKAWKKKLTVLPIDKKTTIAQLTLQDNLTKRGIDFLNHLIRVYNRRANEVKNDVANKTIAFIDKRIGLIMDQLKGTEEDIEKFKRGARLTDITSDAQLALAESSEYEKKRVENETQIQLIQALNEYVMHQGDEPVILPINVGITNQSLGALITQYNELVTERSRLLKSSSLTNPAVVNVNLTLESLLASIKATIKSVQNNLVITKQTLDEQAGIFTSRISDAPAQERQYISYRRNQEIQQSLYLMLLQKKEENAIALAATEDFARIIDAPMLMGTGPIAPRKMMVLAGALFLGLLLPALLIFIKEFFQNRITSLADVQRLSPNLPVVGKLYQVTESNTPLQVEANDNSITTERFRDLRTNLLFIMGEKAQQVVLCTSTVPAEGKTFTAINLAASLALLNKKVLLVGLDIRKPRLALAFNLPLDGLGITDYLSNPEQDLKPLIHRLPGYMHYDVLPTGSIPPNPTELLAKQTLVDLFQDLRTQYDYIVVDTAPIGLVTDTQIIARIADASLYLCRSDYSHKTNLQIANEMYENNRLPQMGLVVNGLNLEKMRRYGYGYGYGYGHDLKKSK